MLLLGKSTSSGTIKIYLPIASDISNGVINGSTIKTYNSAGFGNQTIQKKSNENILTITGVESYAMIEFISSNCAIIQSYFA